MQACKNFQKNNQVTSNSNNTAETKTNSSKKVDSLKKLKHNESVESSDENTYAGGTTQSQKTNKIRDSRNKSSDHDGNVSYSAKKTLDSDIKIQGGGKKIIDGGKKTLGGDKKTLDGGKKTLGGDKKLSYSTNKPLDSDIKTLDRDKNTLDDNDKLSYSAKKPLDSDIKTLDGDKNTLDDNKLPYSTKETLDSDINMQDDGKQNMDDDKRISVNKAKISFKSVVERVTNLDTRNSAKTVEDVERNSKMDTTIKSIGVGSGRRFSIEDSKRIISESRKPNDQENVKNTKDEMKTDGRQRRSSSRKSFPERLSQGSKTKVADDPEAFSKVKIFGKVDHTNNANKIRYTNHRNNRDLLENCQKFNERFQKEAAIRSNVVYEENVQMAENKKGRDFKSDAQSKRWDDVATKNYKYLSYDSDSKSSSDSDSNNNKQIESKQHISRKDVKPVVWCKKCLIKDRDQCRCKNLSSEIKCNSDPDFVKHSLLKSKSGGIQSKVFNGGDDDCFNKGHSKRQSPPRPAPQKPNVWKMQKQMLHCYPECYNYMTQTCPYSWHQPCHHCDHKNICRATSNSPMELCHQISDSFSEESPDDVEINLCFDRNCCCSRNACNNIQMMSNPIMCISQCSDKHNFKKPNDNSWYDRYSMLKDLDDRFERVFDDVPLNSSYNKNSNAHDDQKTGFELSKQNCLQNTKLITHKWNYDSYNNRSNVHAIEPTPFVSKLNNNGKTFSLDLDARTCTNNNAVSSILQKNNDYKINVDESLMKEKISINPDFSTSGYCNPSFQSQTVDLDCENKQVGPRSSYYCGSTYGNILIPKLDLSFLNEDEITYESPQMCTHLEQGTNNNLSISSQDGTELGNISERSIPTKINKSCDIGVTRLQSEYPKVHMNFNDFKQRIEVNSSKNNEVDLTFKSKFANDFVNKSEHDDVRTSYNCKGSLSNRIVNVQSMSKDFNSETYKDDDMNMRSKPISRFSILPNFYGSSGSWNTITTNDIGETGQDMHPMHEHATKCVTNAKNDDLKRQLNLSFPHGFQPNDNNYLHNDFMSCRNLALNHSSKKINQGHRFSFTGLYSATDDKDNIKECTMPTSLCNTQNIFHKFQNSNNEQMVKNRFFEVPFLDLLKDKNSAKPMSYSTVENDSQLFVKKSFDLESAKMDIKKIFDKYR